MAAANSSGGVMGKMIDAQSIVVASTATNWFGHEGTILRYVFWHSVVLAALVGLVVTLQAYVHPFTLLVHLRCRTCMQECNRGRSTQTVGEHTCGVERHGPDRRQVCTA